MNQNELRQKIAETIVKTYDSGKKSFLPTKVHSEYYDPFEFEVFEDVNFALYEMEKEGYVVIKKTPNTNTMIKKVCIVDDKVSELAEQYDIKRKSDLKNELLSLLNKYSKTDNEQFLSFVSGEIEKVNKGKLPKYVRQQDYTMLKDVLIAADAMFKQTDDIRLRDFSQNCFKSTKHFKGAIIDHLYELFGDDFSNSEDLLNAHHIFKNEIFVDLFGVGKIIFKDGQEINLNHSYGTLGLSKSWIQNIEKVETNNVLSIENRTLYLNFQHSDFDGIILFLSGFSNNLNIDFLKKTNCSLYHCGDLDANGFRILHDLQSRVCRKVEPYMMDLECAKKYTEYGIDMDDFNRKTLNKMLVSDEYSKEEKLVFEYLIQIDKIIEHEITREEIR